MRNSSLLSQRVTKLSESATIKMSQMARNLKAEGNDVINLSLGEPDFDTPDHIKEAAIEALNNGITKYTPVPGLLEFRKAIAEKLKRDSGLDYNTNQIVVSNGAKQCIANICLSLLDQDDEVIIFTPYWVSYFEIVKFAGGTPIPLSAGIEDDFKVTAEQLSACINDKTKIILFSSPCNPTGSVYSKDELKALAQVINQHEDLMVISDEIYEYINFAEKHSSIASFEGMFDRTVTVNGMSKGFSMTGWRLGYMAGPEWVAKACVKIQGQFTSGASAFGQMAAAEALRGSLEPTITMTAEFSKRKTLVIKLLNEIPGVKTNNPQGAFYIFPNISAFFGKSIDNVVIKNADDFAMILLEKAHVATVSGSAFGNDECIRISYAASESQLVESMARIKSFLAKLQ